MASNQLREIRYLARDYNGWKSTLMNFVKLYFPNTWQDFSENSPSMALLELVAYVGDVLGYYQDSSFNEANLDRAVLFKNIISRAKLLAYKAKGKRPSFSKADITAVFSSSADRTTYGFVLNQGTQLTTKINPPVVFETLYDIDFSADDAFTFSSLSSDGSFVVTKVGVDIVSGTTKTYTTIITTPQKFLKVTIPDKNVFRINSVIDSNGNNFYEVNALSQDTILLGTGNRSSSSADVQANLKLKYAPRRFVTSLDGSGFTTLTFGSGISSVQEFDFIPAPENYTINQQLLGVNTIPISNISIENFLNTNSLGYSPNNTSLTLSYMVGGGIQTVVGIGVINKLFKALYVAKNSLVQNDVNFTKIINNLTVNNTIEATGGDDADSKTDIKYIAPKYFASQGRAITLQDFIVVAKSMPSVFGSVYRCSAKVDSQINNTVNLYILTKNETQGLKTFQQPNVTIFQNLQNYMKTFRAFNDNIVLKSANIIDIGVEYSIRIDSQFNNANEVLANTLYTLINYFDIANWDIEMPIYMSKVSNIITQVQGVLAVYNLQITQKANGQDGRVYNDSSDIDINNYQKRGAIICPPDHVFQIHYPYFDINGSYIIEQ